MNPRIISYTSLLLSILTLAWILTLVPQMSQYGGTIDSFEIAFKYVSEAGALFYLTYINVVLLTIVDVVLFGLLYLYFRESYPAGSLIGILFVPVYASYNLFVYISQVSVVQRFLEAYETGVSQEILEVFLGQLIQMYENSAIAFLNNYAYAILGIPSILFGVMIYRKGLTGKFTGGFLILSAIASIIGIIGIIAGIKFLSFGSALGGGFFLLSMIGMCILFWNKEAEDF